jgi:hypothetical protein
MINKINKERRRSMNATPIGSLQAGAITMPTAVQENNDSLCLESLETKSDTYEIVRSNTTPCEHIPYQEERAPDDERDAPYSIENIDDVLSDTDSLETNVRTKPPDPLLDSETSNTVFHLEADQVISDRDTSHWYKCFFLRAPN